MMNSSIRAAVVDDYDGICALFEEVDALHRAALPGVFRVSGGAVRERDFVEGMISDPAVGLFVAEDGGVLVGLLHVVLRMPSSFPILVPRRFVVIESVVVAGAYRRQGVGRALMDAAQAWATAQGATEIELNVWAFNREAIAFYEGLGYQTLSRKMHRVLDAAGKPPGSPSANEDSSA